MPEFLDTLAADTVMTARVPSDHAEREVDHLAQALRAIWAGSASNGLAVAELEDEARAVASVTRGTLALRYAAEPVAP